MVPTTDLFIQLLNHTRAQPDRRGEAWTACPFCGKAGKHFSFAPRGYHCFVCGASGSLGKLIGHLGLDGSDPAPAPVRLAPPQPPKPPAPWLANSVQILNRLCSHPDRYAAWERYKPVSRATIDRYRFGYGRLPAQAHPDNLWLTVPLFENGALVGLRGRNLPGQPGPKWTSAGGSRMTLWNLDHVRPGIVLWICENYVDAAWLMQTYPHKCAVAIGGAALWHDGWSAAIAARRPSHVTVALDNDLAGQATGATYARLLAGWQTEHPGLTPPKPNGPKIANGLNAAGICARLYRWPAGAPFHADIGWLLAQEERMAA